MYWQDVVLLIAGALGGIALVRYFIYYRWGSLGWWAASIAVAYVVLNVITTPAVTLFSYIAGKFLGMLGTFFGMRARIWRGAESQTQE